MTKNSKQLQSPYHMTINTSTVRGGSNTYTWCSLKIMHIAGTVTFIYAELSSYYPILPVISGQWVLDRIAEPVRYRWAPAHEWCKIVVLEVFKNVYAVKQALILLILFILSLSNIFKKGNETDVLRVLFEVTSQTCRFLKLQNFSSVLKYQKYKQ